MSLLNKEWICLGNQVLTQQSSSKIYWYWPLNSFIMSGQPVTCGWYLFNFIYLARICSILWVAMLHDKDIPPVHGLNEWFYRLGLYFCQDRSISCAEVTTAALNARHLWSTVMVMNAFWRWSPQFMIIFKVICNISKVSCRPCPSEGA